jgi:hypothetical protein
MSMFRRNRLLGAHVMLCLTVCTARASAQSREAQVLVKPVKSVLSQGGHSYNVFGPLDSIQLQVTLVNEHRQEMLFIEGGFFQAIKWSVTRAGGQPLPMRVDWSPSVTCPGGLASVTDCTISTTIRIEGGESATGIVSVSNAPMRFTPGEYRIGLDLRDARAYLFHGDLTRWSGTMLNIGSIPITIRAIGNESDLRTFQRNEAHYAMAKRQYGTAAAAYEQLLAVNPNDTEAVAGLGMALLHSGRYADAAKLLERVLPSNDQDSTVPRDLSLAYLALGDEAKADLLLRRYYSPSVIPIILKGIRQQLARAPKVPQ